MAHEEKVNFANGNLAKLDVSRGENIVELYVQNNMIEELDISNNKLVRIFDCTGNPLRYIKSCAPGSEGGASLIIEAGKGGNVGLKYAPDEQQYFAYPAEGYMFDGWYDVLGDRVSKEAVWTEAYGRSREIFALFREK